MQFHPTNHGHTGLPWPLLTIDFEASSLEHDGYPIEIGIALWSRGDEPIHAWSALIQPVGEWVRRGHWSQKSAGLHGIARDELMTYGQPVHLLAAAINSVLGDDAPVWCDGGVYDATWMAALFKAAGTMPACKLNDWHELKDKLDPHVRRDALSYLRRTTALHRARDDAARLLQAIAHALNIDPGPVQDLSLRLPILAALTHSSRSL